ncbi:neprilysin-like 8 isoform X2 [Rhodnius prolixus]|uniref:neprilysin-like 8 isoform X2 n=1 Tax=Rhodnius prolixus TaxID=13249 RepID=UPI003D18DDDF
MVLEKDCESVITSDTNYLSKSDSNRKIFLNGFKKKTSIYILMKASIFVFIVAIVLLLTKITEQYTKFHKEDLKKNNLPNIALPMDADTFENPSENLLKDFKTDCFPPRQDYYMPRSRRYLRSSPNFIPFKNNLSASHIITWSLANPQQQTFSDTHSPANQLLSEVQNMTVSSGDISEKGVDGVQEIKVDATRNENGGNADHDILESQSRGAEPDQAKEPLKNILEFGLGADSQRSPWERGNDEEASDDNVDREHICDDLIENQGPVVQHAFWKGEGDKNTIRSNQGRWMKQYMDTCVDPCKDFYQYACGRWSKLNPIPKDRGAYDTFEMLRESLDTILRELLEEKISSKDSAAYIKTKNLYKSCINYEILEQRGAKPLLDLLVELGGWPMITPDWDRSQFDWLWLIAHLRLFNNDILISEWVGPDIKNSDEYVIHFDQTSLGLPTRDYYLQPSNLQYLEAYKNYLIKVATLLGANADTAPHEAEQIIQFEISLAKITSATDERRNVSELYQRMTVGELRTYIPQVDWQRYLTIVLDRPVNVSENVVVFALRYLEDLVALLGKTEPRTISNYLLWRFVRHRVNNLDDRFQDAKQKFYYILFGREESPPRWKNCILQVNSNMGMAMGAMFVRKYFDENSKNDTLIMTREIQQSFREILNMTTWIDMDTKRLATEKVDAMTLRIGYPDSILNREQLDERYKDVIIDPDQYFENTLNILRHLTRIEQGHLGNPVNKSIWNTAPAVVNAYYSRNKNQIMFPAGILQPPFYHRYFPKSLNYGGIGVVIGHEITHGFDDKGRLFDKHGNLHRWWKDEAITNFHERAQCIIDQYSKYVVEEVGIQIDGVNTQGENIADNGGIKESFRAYKKWMMANGDVDETLPGLNYTGLQLFFLNFAQVWCGETRPAASRNKLKTAVHSPGKYRVIGTLSNSEDFSKVFNCPLGSPMNPVKKCSVW